MNLIEPVLRRLLFTERVFLVHSFMEQNKKPNKQFYAREWNCYE